MTPLSLCSPSEARAYVFSRLTICVQLSYTRTDYCICARCVRVMSIEACVHTPRGMCTSRRVLRPRHFPTRGVASAPRVSRVGASGARFGLVRCASPRMSRSASRDSRRRATIDLRSRPCVRLTARRRHHATHVRSRRVGSVRLFFGAESSASRQLREVGSPHWRRALAEARCVFR